MNKAKNPLNVKWAKQTDHSVLWAGSTGYNEVGTAIFEKANQGARAGFRCLEQMYLQDRRTIRSICAEWAPDTDTIGSIAGAPPNDPLAYANMVSSMTAIDGCQTLGEPWLYPMTWVNIFCAMARYELGESCPLEIAMIGWLDWMTDYRPDVLKKTMEG